MFSHNYTETVSHSFDFRPQYQGVDESWPGDCQAWAHAIWLAGLDDCADADGEVHFQVDFDATEHIGWGGCVESSDYEISRVWCQPPQGARFALAGWQLEILEKACSEHWALEMLNAAKGSRYPGPLVGLRVAFEGM